MFYIPNVFLFPIFFLLKLIIMCKLFGNAMTESQTTYSDIGDKYVAEYNGFLLCFRNYFSLQNRRNNNKKKKTFTKEFKQVGLF